MQGAPSSPQPTPGRWRVEGSRSRIGIKTRNFIGMKVGGHFGAWLVPAGT